MNMNMNMNMNMDMNINININNKCNINKCGNYIFMTCDLGHSYCNNCKLHDCCVCKQTNLEQDNCPLCNKTFVYDNENYCEYHYECLKIKICIKCQNSCRPTYNENYCDDCYFKYEY